MIQLQYLLNAAFTTILEIVSIAGLMLFIMTVADFIFNNQDSKQ